MNYDLTCTSVHLFPRDTYEPNIYYTIEDYETLCPGIYIRISQHQTDDTVVVERVVERNLDCTRSISPAILNFGHISKDSCCGVLGSLLRANSNPTLKGESRRAMFKST